MSLPNLEETGMLLLGSLQTCVLGQEELGPARCPEKQDKIACRNRLKG